MGATAAPETRVRQAESAADREAAAEALTLAFTDDPVWRHLLPDDRRRPEQLLAYYTAEIENLVPGLRELWVSDDGGGAALWGRPGAWKVPFGAMAREAAAMLRVFGARLPLGLWTQLRLERHHPRRPHHRYLHYIGVEPRRQGRGLGGALIAPVIEECDRERVPAFVEASTDRNRQLYERHGFVLDEVYPLPPGRRGPPIRKMWREPA